MALQNKDIILLYQEVLRAYNQTSLWRIFGEWLFSSYVRIFMFIMCLLSIATLLFLFLFNENPFYNALYLTAIFIIEIIAFKVSVKSIINFYKLDEYKDFALFHKENWLSFKYLRFKNYFLKRNNISKRDINALIRFLESILEGEFVFNIDWKFVLGFIASLAPVLGSWEMTSIFYKNKQEPSLIMMLMFFLTFLAIIGVIVSAIVFGIMVIKIIWKPEKDKTKEILLFLKLLREELHAKEQSG